MSRFLRVYFVVAAVLAPTIGSDLRAVHDWECRITRPSEWDWLPAAAHLPSLGRHPIPKAHR